MRDFNHTPGPWTVANSHISDAVAYRPRVVEIGNDGDYRGGICRLQSAEHIGGITGDEVLANAALIIAAPDLLAALKQLRAEYESIVRSEFETMSGMPEWFAINVADADAAIAKAEGKP